jgi:hypothetical protein
MLNKIIDFYQTQDLRKQINEKSDLLAISNIVIQYDPSQDSLLVTKSAMENEEGYTVPLAPRSLQPKFVTIHLPSPESRSDWEEPVVTMPEQAYGVDYFMEEEVRDDGGRRRRGAPSRRSRRPVRR